MHTKSKTNWRPSRPIALAAAAIMALAGQALGQISGELNRWHKITLTIDGPSTSETADPNPFRDLRLNVAFTHPASGTTYLVPGYFAADGNAANTSASSGNRWRAHLCPDRTGTWNYTISFRQGADVSTDASPTAGSALAPYDGMSGTFSIAETDKGGRDLRGKGMLQYVGGRYLRFAGSGEHFLKQGADAPENFLAYQDFDGPFKTDGQKDDLVKTWAAHVGDWKSGDPVWQGSKGKGMIGALNYLASEGLNAYSFIPMNIGGDDRNAFPYLNYSERYRMDVSRLAQWEIVFEHADRIGLFQHFKTQETENELLLDNGNVGVQRKLYYRELIARFSHHLAMNWNLGEEINNATTAQKKAWAQYFWDHDPYRHHIVIHNGANHYDLMGAGSKLTGFSLQTSQADFGEVFRQVTNYLARAAAAGKPWAVACDEPGDAQYALRPDYDAGNSHTDGRKNGLWGTLMAGGWGNEWYFGYGEKDNPSKPPEYWQGDLECQDFRSRDSWWDYCRHALAFFNDNAIPFWEMVNDNAKSSNANDYCFHRQGEVYVIYLKGGGTTSLDLSGVSGTFSVQWFNPRSGGGLQTGSVTGVTGGGSRSLGNAPGSATSDWVILVRQGTIPDSSPDITTTSLPGGAVNVDYHETISVAQGNSPLAWSVASGSLPPGLSLGGASGVISGTPTAQGSYAFSVRVTDADGDADTQALGIAVAEEPTTVTVTFHPTEDAYIQGSTRYNDAYLKVQPGSRVSYLKFDVAGINPDVIEAKLRLKVQGDAGNGTIRYFLGSGNNWTEDNLSTSNAPAATTELAATSGSYSIGTVYEADFTSLLNGTGDGTYSIAIKMDSGGNDAWFSSKEGTAPPELAVTYDTGPRPEAAFDFGTIDVPAFGPENWFAVNFAAAFQEPPAVFVGGPTAAEGQPLTVRVRNITATGFEFQPDEWEYLDGAHAAETVSFIALSKGANQIGGMRCDAGTIQNVGTGWKTQQFAKPFTNAPCVFVQCTSVNEPTAVCARVRNASADSFQVLLQEQETNNVDRSHAPESVDYIAIEPGTVTALIEVGLTARAVNQNWYPLAFSDAWPNPGFVGCVQSYYGSQPCTLRYRNLSDSGAEVKVDEDGSNGETGHTTEVVGWLAFSEKVAPPENSIVSYTLINADTDLPMPGFDPLPDGAQLNLGSLPTQNLNIRANVNPEVVTSVTFVLDAGTPRTENAVPYALAGDSPTGNYRPWTPTPGNHTLTATPKLNGINGTPLTIHFSVAP